MNIELQPDNEIVLLANMSAFGSIIIGRIKESQKSDSKIARIFEQISMRIRFEVMDNMLYFRGTLCLPDVDRLQDEIMTEAHHISYSIHPGSMKIFQSLKDRYWRNNMEKEIASFASHVSR